MNIASQKELNLEKEAQYIIKQAKNRRSRIVSLGSLVLFSTATGDAWLLDVDDNFAMCLAVAGEEQEYQIVDTPHDFKIEWKMNFRIEKDKFIVLESNGQIRTIFGYPTKEIVKFMKLVQFPGLGNIIDGQSPPPIFHKPLEANQAPGRNAPCPCGSGLKYKKCCMSKKT